MSVEYPPLDGVREPARRLSRTVAVTALVLLCFALALRLADAIPAWWRDEPRSVRRYDSIEALERDTRTQLLLPFYFPEILSWPPAAVSRAAGDGRPTCVVFTERATGRPRLLIAQCLDGECAIPSRLLPPAPERGRSTVDLPGGPRPLVRRAGPDGAEWTDVDWHLHGRRIVMRMYGDAGELPRIARSMRRGHP
jgi:hypothetical protein